MSFRGGALWARTFWSAPSRRRIKFFFRGGLSGDPSCPAMKKLNFGGMGNARERSMPVSFSPPGERLQMNCEFLSPSEDSRFSRNHGLVVSPPLMGELRHSRAAG